MSAAFSRSMRSLALDSSRPSMYALLFVAALLAAWVGWFLLARITVYEVSQSARLEVDQAAHPIAAQSEGRVVASYLELGREVQPGDVLVELEAEAERLSLEEARTRVATFSPQLVGLYEEIKAEEEARRRQEETAQAAINEARKLYEEGLAASDLADEEAKRLERLHAGGVLPEMDLLRAKAEAQKRRAAAEALRLQISERESDRRSKLSDARVRIERLNRQITALQGQFTGDTASVNRAGYEVERRRIRASVAGRLGEVAQLRQGAVVHVGDKLAVIIPQGELKAIAEFAPSDAIGRIREGQPAEMRLDGFPWAQYGSIRAVVTSISNEPRDGRIRVEFAVEQNQPSPIPIQHGLPGTIEVEVERASPAKLLLRAAGKRLTASESPFQDFNQSRERR